MKSPRSESHACNSTGCLFLPIWQPKAKMRRPTALPTADRWAELEAANQQYLTYIREKTNQLLKIMGAECMQTQDLDAQTLIELDPIGTIADSFAQVLDFLGENISELQQARDELQRRQWTPLPPHGGSSVAR
jgi:hypothetical protein